MGGDVVNKGRSPRAVLRGSAALVLAAGLGACKMGPDYHRPDLWSPSHYDMHGNAVQDAQVKSVLSSAAPDPHWWRVFHDPELTSLEERVVRENLDVLRAATQLAQSRAQLLMAGAERFPALTAAGSYRRTQYSTKEAQYLVNKVGRQFGGPNGNLLADSAGDVVVPLLNQWSDSIDATYEVDLWGRVARQYEEAKAQLEASDEARRGILIAQQADMARDYMTLRGAQEQLRIARANRGLQADTLALAKDRFRSGLVTDLDVQSAEAQLAATDAQVTQLQQQIAQEMNAISLLLGAPPGALNGELDRAAGIPVIPPRVPVGVPSELAQRRPDIRRADAQLHVAVAQVGEAMAEFYPKVTISADFGFQSLSFRDLGFWNARAWNVGPSISLPIFQGGRLRGQLQLKKSAQKEAAIAYQQTVLGAWREVDNALIAYRDEQLRRDSLVKAVDANRKAVALARDQYRSGLVTYLNVLSAQGNQLVSEQRLADSTTVLASDLVALYNALGGGWETDFPLDDPSKATVTRLASGAVAPSATGTPAPR
ncbi:efflux transporter outer membrane subunit [Acidomonas methanolica]|uniref:Secretion system type I outer membrane RND efflux pump lipoprotein NodT n=1 Tax=Acidomonas methanolica NBRC 104435 TaxID=1231351 RepID=A0A023D250_ACIMT|nr:efflux transporter outer membrane subunit [Acidomonas methanolica]MBU2655341.1 efflux transporter outer membrane subunit [Acidomonas methanolica]TCS23758.1 NodT family efflux transporter outer membrane factor (OMF) lipoprotein [Acidomonas methanolica]GAJ27845.1 secretion system type I outer membrane RND efflux pump lipoprotein NodT [Acidomonas methanolica NBRC 104435]GBQ49291.1 secretion system type I outer membrane efflux pump lipoprotein NodT [Acidomonas methanolica]GEL00229.1 hypothetica